MECHFFVPKQRKIKTRSNGERNFHLYYLLLEHYVL